MRKIQNTPGAPGSNNQNKKIGAPPSALFLCAFVPLCLCVSVVNKFAKTATTEAQRHREDLSTSIKNSRPPFVYESSPDDRVHKLLS